ENPGVMTDQRGQPLAQFQRPFVDHQVGGVRDQADLPADRVDDCRVGVAEGADRDTGVQVEVLVAVGVPDVYAAATGDRERRGPVVGHEGLVPPGLHRRELSTHWLASLSGSTIVPTPSSVNTSSSTTCGTRPSRTCA